LVVNGSAVFGRGKEGRRSQKVQNAFLKDMAYRKARVALTTAGIAMLAMLILLMGGMMNALKIQARQYVESTGADIWIYNEGSGGPFIGFSMLNPEYLGPLVRTEGLDENVPLAPLIFAWAKPTIRGKEEKVIVVGCRLGQLGCPSEIVKGRTFQTSEPQAGTPAQAAMPPPEVVVDEYTGLEIGDKIQFGEKQLEVVGLTRGQLFVFDTPILFMELRIAQGVALFQDYLHVNAMLAKTKAGFSPSEVAKRLNERSGIEAYTEKQTTDDIIRVYVIDPMKAVQALRVVLWFVAFLIITMITYVTVSEKRQEIGMLKAIGATNRYVIFLVLKQVALMASIGIILGTAIAHLAAPLFPIFVVINPMESLIMAVITLVFCGGGGYLATRRTISIDPMTAFRGQSFIVKQRANPAGRLLFRIKKIFLKDMVYRIARVLLTVIAVAFLVVCILLIGGIMNGLKFRSGDYVKNTGADVWVYSEGSGGPFVGLSWLYYPDHRTFLNRIEGVSKKFPPAPLIFIPANPIIHGKRRRVTLVGCKLGQLGAPITPTVENRLFEPSKFMDYKPADIPPFPEVVVDESIGLEIGESIEIGEKALRVVGKTKGQMFVFDSPLIFMELRTAQSLVWKNNPCVNTVLIKTKPGYSPSEVAAKIDKYENIGAFTTEKTINTILDNFVTKPMGGVQALRGLLWLITGLIVSMITYVTILEKRQEIGVLKAIGASNRYVISLVLKQSILMAVVGLAIGMLLAAAIIPKFPMTVLLSIPEFITVSIVTLFVCCGGALLATRAATSVDPMTAFRGI